jgi:hypothetical protein
MVIWSFGCALLSLLNGKGVVIEDRSAATGRSSFALWREYP